MAKLILNIFKIIFPLRVFAQFNVENIPGGGEREVDGGEEEVTGGQGDHEGGGGVRPELLAPE